MCAQCVMGAVAGFGVYQAYKHVIRGQVESVYQRVLKRPNEAHVTRRESQTREQLIDRDPWSTTEEASESEVASAGQELAGGGCPSLKVG